MNPINVLEDPITEQWFTLIEAAQNTREQYTKVLEKFCQLAERTPTQLVEEAEREIMKGVLPRKRSYVEYLIRFRRLLEEEGYSPGTKRIYPAIIRGFYRTFDIEVPKLFKAKRRTPTLDRNNKKRLDKETIIKIVSMAPTIRDKALILCGLQSGQGINELLNLRYRDVKEDFEAGEKIIRLTLTREKTGNQYYTFFGQDATRALHQYIDWRNRHEKLKVTGDDDYVFVQNLVAQPFETTRISNKTGTVIKKKIEYGRKLDRHNVARMMRLIARKLGYSNGKGAFNPIRFHSLRAAHRSLLVEDGVDSFLIDFWQGKAIPEDKLTYYNANLKKITEIFLEHENALSITTIEVPRDQEIVRLTEENKELMQRVENQDRRIRDLEQLKIFNETADKVIEVGISKKLIQLKDLLNDPDVKKILEEEIDVSELG
jgi:integrase